jgi:epidermal growth factor receptor substrate 15
MAPWVVVGAPVLSSGSVRPPLSPHVHSQTDATSRSGQPRSQIPGMDNHVATQGNKDDRTGVNSVAQEGADAPKKACGYHTFIFYILSYL